MRLGYCLIHIPNFVIKIFANLGIGITGLRPHRDRYAIVYCRLLTIGAHISGHFRVLGLIEMIAKTKAWFFPVEARAIDRFRFTLGHIRDVQLLATQCPVGEARICDVEA